MSKFCFLSDLNPFIQSKWKERAKKFNENLEKQVERNKANGKRRKSNAQ